MLFEKFFKPVSEQGAVEVKRKGGRKDIGGEHYGRAFPEAEDHASRQSKEGFWKLKHGEGDKDDDKGGRTPPTQTFNRLFEKREFLA